MAELAPGGLPFGVPPPAQQPWQQPAPAPLPMPGAGMPGAAPAAMSMGEMPQAPEPDSTAIDEAPRRRRRSLKIDKERAAARVLDTTRKARDERTQWMDERLVRYAKLRGWRQKQTYPWDGAHNEHVPLMMSNSLRIQAGLFNAVMGNKPMMQGRSLRRDRMDAADKAANLIEFQLMHEADGEQKISQAVDQFCNDGTIVSYQPWVKDSRLMVDVRVISGPPDETIIEDDQDEPTAAPMDLSRYLLNTLPNIIDGLERLRDETLDGYNWTGTWTDGDGQERNVQIEIWDREDGKLDVEMRWEATTFDGPTAIIHQLEDITVPIRSLNTQPVTPQNPFGAPWISRRLRVNLDTIKRRKDNGTYDLLTDDDWDQIVAFADGRQAPDLVEGEDQMKAEKEAQAGLVSDWSALDEDKQWLDIEEWYGSYPVHDQECEVVIHVIDVPSGITCRARYLSEVCPGSPQWRPFAEERFIPVPDCFYGISVPEVLEGLHDLLHELFNANLDRGDIANLPVMLYRASSGVKPEEMRARPGDWIPVDNPKDDAAAVQYPHSDQSWSFNMIGLVQQLSERLIQVGSLQFGQVPQGKASALRTVGTTMAILQQGAALPEQILRRFFHWLQQVYAQFHMLNTKFLPPKKRVLILGKDPASDDAYQEMGPQDIQAPVSFEFGATLLNTNKGITSQSLSEIGQAIFNPLAFQLGITGPEQFYQWAKDKINAAQLDPQRYLKRPAGTPDTPPMSANDAITMLVEGKMPPGVNFVEGAIAGFEALAKWYQSDDFGRVHPTNLGIVREFLQMAQADAMQEQQRMQAAQAAEQFQGMMGNKGQGAGTSMGGEAPEMQTEAPTQAEIAGGGTQGQGPMG